MYINLAHSHHLINLIVNNKTYEINNSIAQLVFTFIFGLYCFYLLKVTQCIWAVIFLHSYCNYLGPPVINKDNLIQHFISIGAFLIYTYFVY